MTEVLDVYLIDGTHANRHVEVLSGTDLIAVSPAGDAEALERSEAADAVVRGHELYVLVSLTARDRGAFRHTTLHDLMKASA